MDHHNSMKSAEHRTILGFTLAEMQRLFASSRFWFAFVAIVLMLSIGGPFNTINVMNFPERLAFWLLTSAFTFGAGFFISMFFGEWFQRAGLPEIIARLVAGSLAGLPVALIVWLIGLLLFEFNAGKNLPAFLVLFAQCAAISAAVSALFILVPRQEPSVEAQSNDQVSSKSESPFFDRLPIELGKDLISLQAQDHYLKITTKKGSEMVLLRMNDACKELADFDGMQVHRSWWVANDNVVRLEKNKAKISLVLSDGQTVPVSRGFAAAVKQRFSQLQPVS